VGNGWNGRAGCLGGDWPFLFGSPLSRARLVRGCKEIRYIVYIGIKLLLKDTVITGICAA
jgi:hypothetical protein